MTQPDQTKKPADDKKAAETSKQRGGKHPEIGGADVSCTCHSGIRKATAEMPDGRAFPPKGTDVDYLVRAFPSERDGLTAEEAAALIDKEVG